MDGLPLRTILLADDNRNIREFCRATLEDDGYRVVLACDGYEAIRLFSKERPDLAILDISMPKADGLEVLRLIRGWAPHFPVVLFTAHDEDCLYDRRASLAAAVIKKSEDLSELKRVVHREIRASRSEGYSGTARIGLPPLPAEASNT
ncbi:MAG: response regulator [Thermoguttaceae bacterium]